MLIYLARRLVLALVTCAAISVLTFVIIRLPPGDFVDAYIANLAVGGSTVSAEQAAAMRREYGLDQPLVVQYGLWMGKVLTGDFGVSMMWRRPVTEVIGKLPSYPATATPDTLIIDPTRAVGSAALRVMVTTLPASLMAVIFEEGPALVPG